MEVLKYKEFDNESLNEDKFSEDDRVRTKGGIDFGDEMFTVIHQKGNKVTVEDDEDEIRIFKASELELAESVNEVATVTVNVGDGEILPSDIKKIERLPSNGKVILTAPGKGVEDFASGMQGDLHPSKDNTYTKDEVLNWLSGISNESLNEDRAGITKILTNLTGDFFGFLKALDKELPQKARSNPDMKKDLVQLMNLKKTMLQSMDDWSEYLIDMDEKYPG